MAEYIKLTDALDAVSWDTEAYTAINMLPSVELIRCKDCKHFEYDHPYVVHGVPVLGHLVCNKWGNGCRTDENGFCFMAERREDA